MPSKASTQERLDALARLREWCKPGDTLYTILRHVSRSGMQRTIGLVVFRDGVARHPNYAAGVALGIPVDRQRDGVKVRGCGTDMGYNLVYGLSATLFPEGFGCIGEGCPSNDHSNGDRSDVPHSESAPHWHRDSGYALRQRWL